jgi:hypothetical protein
MSSDLRVYAAFDASIIVNATVLAASGSYFCYRDMSQSDELRRAGAVRDRLIPFLHR